MESLHEFMRHAKFTEYFLALGFLFAFWGFWWLLVQKEDVADQGRPEGQG
jgi:hypothetical protein